MFIINGILVHPELFSQQFVCNLSKCKGACCWEGDYGAPVTKEELEIMEQEVHQLLPLLPEASQERIRAQGVCTYDSHYKDLVTPLMPNGACAFLLYDEIGIAKCGWEKAHELQLTSFKKPISCHLYPVRAKIDKQISMTELRYDVWNICSAACTLGVQLQMPVFRFVSQAIIRQYGQDFYEQMEQIFSDYFGNKQD